MREEGASQRDGGIAELHGAFTADKFEKCVNKDQSHTAAGADGSYPSSSSVTEKGRQKFCCATGRAWKNRYAQSRWRKGEMINLFKKGE